MKNFKLFVYLISFLVLLVIFIAYKTNFSLESMKMLHFKQTNTQMSISTGTLKDYDMQKHKSSNNKFLLKNYKIKNQNKDKYQYDNKELLTSYLIKNSNNNIERKIYIIRNGIGKCGLIDDSDKKIVKIVYDEFIEFDKNNGIYISCLNDKKGLVSIYNGVIIPAKFENIEKTSNKNIVLLKNYKYYGLYDISNKSIILRPLYAKLTEFDKNNWQIISNKKVGHVFADNGKFKIIKPTYHYTEPYKKVFKSYIGEKIGLISSRGEVLAEPYYNNIELINEKDAELNNIMIFRTSIDNRYGIIYYTPYSVTVIPPIYSDVQYKGLVNVLSDGYWRILDNQGNVIPR